ncbi:MULTISPECIES: class I SAM-dependent DNA methyltransferase [unclassified Pseudoalteromonas]|uniref:type I restriction-modification system subunit M n=1 Tax=unclassified Pseudoalteromonas TaxID=194690 RepID=UPI0025B2E69F|nr:MULTISPECIES: class I SAM-dependent DNA methyltransferase [unclassified Pseudoalteromonas]MDN3396805.1 class I SAM-dependent DNA methyltransferase [Pseudoalteromonas sp. APC 3215]MDN3472845.1 class I SAM-dependent DNA methyltransferase [Pseudoalteromonas sp. APC 4026]
MTDNNFSSTAAFLWSVADLLRGDFKQSQYGRIILPFTLLRRLECVLEATKPAVLEKYETVKSMPIEAQDKLLTHAAQLSFYNTSKMDLNRLGETDVASNLESYIQSFSPNAREIFEHFDFFNTLDKLAEADLLYKVAKRFATTDLHPDVINNYGMGLVFEELIRRFAESSNETAGEHFTPRDIVRLTTSLVFTNDDDALTQSGLVRSIYDPTAGTGGFLSSGMEYVLELNDKASLSAFGQELNPESYAICKADMLIKGQKVDNIKLGNTLSNDQLRTEKFDYMLSNPPFGVDWKKIQKQINDEHTEKGFEGRFGAGLPRVSDGSLLFLMHLVSKMRPQHEGGSRIGIILNGSPLFTGGAGSGESEIRRYILENDLLEAIVALPTDMFYNTGISTYVWVLSSHKPANRKGKVQLINAAKERAKTGGRGRSGGGEVEGNDENVFYAAMRKSLGSKRKELTEDAIETIVKTYGQFVENDFSKIFDYQEFGYRRITVERPLQLAVYPKDELRITALTTDKAWDKLNEHTQHTILSALALLNNKYLSRDAFLNALTTELETATAAVKLSAAQLKVIVKHLSEHDDEAEICKTKGKLEANPDLRDNENVPLTESVDDYFAREVLPHVPNAWIDTKKTDEQDGEVGIVGYEIPFNRHFYEYVPPRSLTEIDADLDKVSSDIMQLLNEVHS